MLASSNDIDNEPIFRAYESALKELESVVGSEPSNSAGISEKLLDILLVRDRVQKEFVSNVSPGSANLGLKLNELDRQFKINFRKINQKLKLTAYGSVQTLYNLLLFTTGLIFLPY